MHREKDAESGLRAALDPTDQARTLRRRRLEWHGGAENFGHLVNRTYYLRSAYTKKKPNHVGFFLRSLLPRYGREAQGECSGKGGIGIHLGEA